jgi:hypothetical protein
MSRILASHTHEPQGLFCNQLEKSGNWQGRSVTVAGNGRDGSYINTGGHDSSRLEVGITYFRGLLLIVFN